ncbi:OLC1v1028680C1 [Oldenlandia corymbosa var. corymbosa]|uniref:OLC1v1028680C1 n=1 Tax=Oldenlandia corymbosa var. corymbosa TaxID=529605 RepID=A0AAV1CD08_OLDCO|nr:OLC1v1028680C1 [Oldenlandia corymbosa var. corymbosa]
MIKAINLLNTMPRRPPLHTIGASILAIIHNSCTRANNVNGPLRLLTKRATELLNSSLLQLVCTILYQWLAILFMADDYILAFEDAVEKIFPLSNRLFDGIDRLVYDAECLPSKFDDAMDTLTLPKFVRIFSPFLANCLIISSWLISCLISTLTLLGVLKSSSNNKKEEKNNDVNIKNIIMVDHHADSSLSSKNNIPSRNYSGRVDISRDNANSDFDIHRDHDHFPCVETTSFTYPHHQDSIRDVPYYDKQGMVAHCDKLESFVECNHQYPNNVSPNDDGIKCSYKEILEKKDGVDLNHPKSVSSNGMKCSYKEVLEKGSKQEEEEEDTGSPAGSTISHEEKISEGGREKDIEGKKINNDNSSATQFSFNLNDPILELYEASWHLK